MRVISPSISPRVFALLTRLSVNLNHFRLLRVVGKGAFGKVRIVERKDSGLTFALKYIRKDEGKSARSSLVLVFFQEQDTASCISLDFTNVFQWCVPRACVISSVSGAC